MRRRHDPSSRLGRERPYPLATCSGGSRTSRSGSALPTRACTRPRRRRRPAARAPPRRPDGTRRYRPVPASANPDLNVTEPAGRRSVPDPPDLPRLTLPAVRGSPDDPVLPTGDRVTGAPEPGGDARVVRIPVHLREPTMLDPPGGLASELEVDPLVVDRPRVVRGHEDAVVGVGDDLGERALARLDRDIRHADQWEVRPPVRPRGPVRGLIHDARR